MGCPTSQKKLRSFFGKCTTIKSNQLTNFGKGTGREKYPIKVCGLDETIDHIIFGCTLAQIVWCVCAEICRGHRAPTGVHEWQENILEGVQRETYRFFIFLFGCVVWSLWLIMNDCVFNNVVVSSPNVGISRVIFFMQRWAILAKGDGRLRIAGVNCLNN